jgi:hypothetical protein
VGKIRLKWILGYKDASFAEVAFLILTLLMTVVHGMTTNQRAFKVR